MRRLVTPPPRILFAAGSTSLSIHEANGAGDRAVDDRLLGERHRAVVERGDRRRRGNAAEAVVDRRHRMRIDPERGEAP